MQSYTVTKSSQYVARSFSPKELLSPYNIVAFVAEFEESVVIDKPGDISVNKLVRMLQHFFQSLKLKIYNEP